MQGSSYFVPIKHGWEHFPDEVSFLQEIVSYWQASNLLQFNKFEHKV